MLKTPITVYAIYTTKNEYTGAIDEFFDTFEEAMANRMKYADWYRSNGNVEIRRIVLGKDMETVERWCIDQDGTIKSHYIF